MIEEIKEITNKMIKTSQPNGVFLTAGTRDKIIYYINNSLEEIERLNNIKKKAINELFDLKDMIYKPETREINFDIQRKISSIIKILILGEGLKVKE